MELKTDIKWDDQGLVPAIVQDARTGQVLMLAYVNREALEKSISTGEAHFWSRSRSELWHKGATSGNTQRIVEIRYDCDADTLLLRVEPRGPACHTGQQSCFYRCLVKWLDGRVVKWSDQGLTDHLTKDQPGMSTILEDLFDVIRDRKVNPKEGSYTCRLFAAGENEILKKIGEEVVETIVAAKGEDDERLVYEVADLLYHALVLLAYRDLELADVEDELIRRFKPA